MEGIILESETFIKKIRILENHPDIRGIVIHINSPGGAVAPSQEIYEEILRIRQKIPVYASLASVAASGGYYIAIAANKIYANSGSITGSIGVILQTYNIQKLMDKIGIYPEIIKSGEIKDIGSSFRKMTLTEKKLLKSLITDTHQQFIEAVAKNRPIDLELVKTLADGRIFTGNQAIQTKLIDQIGTFRQTIQQLSKSVKVETEYEIFYAPDEKDTLLGKLDLLDSISRIKESIISGGVFFLAPDLINL
ncbi:MAG: signal peptide peptidase SppA [Deltaproteobacteria bacterium]|nr:signal peptide peptidase SppA [Deltaproteobacteria bacterium]MBT4527588.1 signal peptide peptidase SppA [Deltaproteobacteria bacterium]